jgi:hypothetical protein
MGLNDFINSPEKLNRLWADMKAMWPFLGMAGVGIIIAEPRALHLTRNWSGNMWAFLPWQLWACLAFVLFIMCFAWVDTLIAKGVAASGPSVERAKEFLQVVGSLDAEQLTTLALLVKSTHLDPAAPNNMHIGGNEDALMSLHRASRNVFPTDGKNQIWITAAYRPFALKWVDGRTAAGIQGSSRGGANEESHASATNGVRRLSAAQSAQIVQALKSSKGHLSICNYLAAHDADQFADDIARAFRDSGWQVERRSMMQIRVPPPTGIAIELPGEDAWQPPPKMADDHLRTLLGDAMNAAKLSVDIRSRTEPWGQVHACMIIGHRPREG